MTIKHHILKHIPELRLPSLVRESHARARLAAEVRAALLTTRTWRVAPRAINVSRAYLRAFDVKPPLERSCHDSDNGDLSYAEVPRQYWLHNHDNNNDNDHNSNNKHD